MFKVTKKKLPDLSLIFFENLYVSLEKVLIFKISENLDLHEEEFWGNILEEKMMTW